MADLLKQSSTAQPLVFLMIDSSDHITGKTGLSPTVTLSKSGGSFASPSGAVTEIANGWYKCAGNAIDTGTLGPLILHATASGADPTDVEYSVVAFDPQSTTAMITGINSLAPPAAWNTDIVQSGDSFPSAQTAATNATTAAGGITSLLATGGAALTALGDGRIANLDTTVSSRAQTGDAMALTTSERNSVADAYLDRANAIETNITPRQLQRLIMAILSGKSTETTGTYVLKRADGNTTAVTITHDANGQRTGVTIGTLT